MNSIPKSLLVIFVLVGGVLLIVLLNPPTSVCDVQEPIFQKEVQGFLLPNEKKKIKKPKYILMMSQCKDHALPGSCYELFNNMRKMLDSLESVPQECRADFSNKAFVKVALLETVDLLVSIAWGSQPPESFTDKFSWLDQADIFLFCKLKSNIEENLGKEIWDGYQESLFTKLPGVTKLSRTAAWQRMLPSVNCQQYM